MWRSGGRLGVRFLLAAKKAHAPSKWASLAIQAAPRK
jgi:hypothetical protein